MYHQDYAPFSQKSEAGKLALKVHFTREEVEQFGETFPVQIPWFTLEDVASGRSLWCRRGDWRRDDPHAFYVSDEGWSVINFHGRDKHARLTVLSPEGRIVLTVGITCFTPDFIDQTSAPEGQWVLWSDDHVEWSTAGILWDSHSRCRFFRWAGHLYFAGRMEWGRYLVIDLQGARVVDETEAFAGDLFSELARTDEAWALGILQKTIAHREELESHLRTARREGTYLPEPLAALWNDAFVALLIVRQRRVKAATALLEELQSLSDPAFQGCLDIHPVKKFGFTCRQYFREHVHLAMLRVGARPKGYALRIFSAGGKWPCSQEHCLAVPECVADREDILLSLAPGLAPRDVVFRLGAPEYIRDARRIPETWPRGDDLCFECWDYDQPAEDGTAVSWGLLWRLKKTPLSPEEAAALKGDFFEYNKYKEAHPDDPEAATRAELVSITRFVWDEAYWMMREGRY